MPVEIKIVTGISQLKQYINFPAILHKENSNYVPPFYNDELDFHNPQKNKHLLLSDYITVLAERDGKICGRVMGIIYHPWNERNQEKSARFYQLDCINDQETAKVLLDFIEKWATEKGADHLVGSFGFSDKDPQGIQTEGFDFPPVLASVSHGSYLSGLVEYCGYTKFKDCVSYRLEIPESIPEVYTRIYHRALRNQQLKLIEFKNRKSLKPWFIPVMELMNDGYKDIYGFVPLDEKDITNLADQYLSVLNPQLVKVVINELNQPVAFVIAMANISKGIRKAKGHIFPFGFIPILVEMSRSRQLDLLLGAVAGNYRKRGLNVLMGISLMETARKLGMTTMDSHLILEENKLMRGEIEKLGGTIHKRYRIYRKFLE